MKTKISN